MTERRKRKKTKIKSLVERFGKRAEEGVLVATPERWCVCSVFWIWPSVTFGVLGCPLSAVIRVKLQ